MPTWLLFVMVFVGGFTVLAAIVFAVVVLVSPLAEELDDLGTSDAPTVDSAADTTDAGVGDDGLLVGQCVNRDQLDEYIVGNEFSVTSCASTHDYEVYFVLEFAAGPYPGEDEILDELYDICRGEFEIYVGSDYDTSSLDMYRLWPQEGLWDTGNRIAECLLYGLDGEPLTGSARDSGW